MILNFVRNSFLASASGIATSSDFDVKCMPLRISTMRVGRACIATSEGERRGAAAQVPRAGRVVRLLAVEVAVAPEPLLIITNYFLRKLQNCS